MSAKREAGSSSNVEDDGRDADMQNNFTSQQSHAELIQDLTGDAELDFHEGPKRTLPSDSRPEAEFTGYSRLVEHNAQALTKKRPIRRLNPKLERRDHDYSDYRLDSSASPPASLAKVNERSRTKYKTVATLAPLLPSSAQPAPSSPKECSITRVKNISELKKLTPRVKLLSPEVTNLSQLTRMNVHRAPSAHCAESSAAREPSVDLSRRDHLKDYCRTCAGLKLPLVDIFSEKGQQMRLNQQIKHLEEINQEDSLSTQMCMDCICDLKMSYKFFMQIKKAQVKLQSIHASLQATTAAPILRLCEEDEKSRLKSSPEKSRLSPLEVADETPIKAEPEPETEFTFRLSDSESIEEFDPEDPPAQRDNEEENVAATAAESSSCFDPEAWDTGENDSALSRAEEIPTILTDRQEIRATDQRPKFEKNPTRRDEAKPDVNKTVYQYDATLKAYIKVEPPPDEAASPTNSSILESRPKPPDPSDYEASTAAAPPSKHPNILKRKIPIRKDFLGIPAASATSVSESTFAASGQNRDTKKPKLNVENAVNVATRENEDGIMYVTVKGTKPNELLLVKVKKMEKASESRREERRKQQTATTQAEIAPVDKILRKIREEPPSAISKDPSARRSKALDIREQIIADQIEEYKKKREKVLGGTAGLPNALKFEDGMIRFVNPIETPEPREALVKVEPAEDLEEIRHVAALNDDESVDDAGDEETPKAKPENPRSPVSCDNTGEYLSRLAKLKRKWEEAKRKKESLQRELAESYTEGNLEKLARILGEKEKNLREFQDYLKQRKIVITRLKDEDIISLYEDRANATQARKSLPDLIDATPPTDYIAEENYLECDYCPATFALRDLLEEHLKSHDYKLVYYCEDCREEFPTIKAKRGHNVGCIKKLVCRYCELMLDSKGKKRQHEQKHVDSIYGQLCEVCGEKFKHQGTLDQHFKTQHMTWEKIYECPKCPKKFAFKQKLTFHLKSVHTSLRAYLCEDCGADFKNPASLRHHRIRKHHPTGNKRECPVCSKLVPFYSLSKHMYTHKAYTIQCPHCDKMFKNSSTLKQHVRIHEDQRQYRCDTCGVGFNRRDGLRLHMRVHQKTDSRALKECSCQICSEKFPNHSMLVIHRNRVHKDGRQYTCHICNRSMLSTRSLEWHMSHIHNEALPDGAAGTEGGGGSGGRDEGENAPEKKRVACVHCEKTFKTEMILRTHIKNTHMEKDPTKCLDCELTFTSDVRLRHHMMVAHNRLEGTLPCPHCSKRFVNQLRLKTHMISHSEDRPYTCEICGFNLKTKIQLIKHHQNRHSDERPLQCRYCPWRCKQVSALVCHERTHTNERPYSCIVCRQRFKYLGDKNKHERRHESLGGSGFKRIVAGRNLKQPKTLRRSQEESGSTSEQDNLDYENREDERFEEEQEEIYEEEQREGIVKFEESDDIGQQYEQSYQQEYEETSREASEAAEVIMSMEDTTVYTEEVTADNIETAEMITDEIMTNQILQSGTVVHLQQQDDTGKIQVIPVMLSLPDLSDSSAEVNLATASIMYNN